MRTSGWRSSSTLWEDDKAQHESRHEVNMTRNDPRTEAWSHQTPEDLNGRCGSSYAKYPYPTTKKMTSRTHMDFGKYSRKCGKHRGRRWARTGPKKASADWPRVFLGFALFQYPINIDCSRWSCSHGAYGFIPIHQGVRHTPYECVGRVSIMYTMDALEGLTGG
jgi:hypothetical protein